MILLLNYSYYFPERLVRPFTVMGGGGQGGNHLLPSVPFLQPPVPFCELSPAYCFFSNDLAMLLY